MKRVVLFSLFASLFISACGAPHSDDSEPSAIIAEYARRWPNPKLIPICIVNRNDIHESLYHDLLNTTVTQYRRAGVGFQKWKDCQPEDFKKEMIRVKFKNVYDWSGNRYSAGGGMSKVGRTSSSLKDENGATLYVKLGYQYPSQNEPRKRQWIMRLTRHAMLHEIGHALGLLHEHQRTDFKPDGGECSAALKQADKPEEKGRITYVGPVEYNSVMSYCNLEQDFLGKGDIAGIHALYPQLKN